MKRTAIILSIFTLSVLLFACNTKGNKDKDSIKVEYSQEDEDLYNFEAFSLNPYGINALLYLPDESASIGASTEPEILHEIDGYEWDVIVGQNFHIKIEDWGDDSFQEYVASISNQGAYDIEFLVQEENFIYYKATLKNKGSGNDSVGIEHVSYHIAAQHTIRGINYVFRSSDDGCSKEIAEYMAKTVKSVKELDADS